MPSCFPKSVDVIIYKLIISQDNGKNYNYKSHFKIQS